MLLRRRPAAVNLGQTKYFYRSSGVFSLHKDRGRQRKKRELPNSIYGNVYFFTLQAKESGNLQVIQLNKSRFRICKHISKL